jgi:hypothetical protein
VKCVPFGLRYGFVWIWSIEYKPSWLDVRWRAELAAEGAVWILGCLGGEAVEFWPPRRASVTGTGSARSEERGGSQLDVRPCLPLPALGLPFALCPSLQALDQAFHGQAA